MTNLFNEDCPRCGGPIPNAEFKGKYPGAASRWADRTVEVCSACGQDEALIQWAAAMTDGGDPELAVHPIHGTTPWVTVPTGI